MSQKRERSLTIFKSGQGYGEKEIQAIVGDGRTLSSKLPRYLDTER